MVQSHHKGLQRKTHSSKDYSQRTFLEDTDKIREF